MSNIYNNYKSVLHNIRETKKKISNFPSDFKLIAVSKTFGESVILQLLEKGHRAFGENKVQEAEKKWIGLKKQYGNVDLHLIGPLQTNKTKKALEVFDCIHSIDREKLVKKIQNTLELDTSLKSKNHSFFVQVNTGEETQKSGINLKDTYDFVQWSKNEIKLNVVGLMCIPPVNEKPAKHFFKLKTLSDKLKLPFTSMGMTSDYLEAIEHGATHVRVGSAIFGKRTVQM